MGEPMRFAGKVDGWYYALTVGVNVMLAWPLTSFFADPAKEGAFISAVVCSLCLVLCDIFIIPTLLRNYVEFDGKGQPAHRVRLPEGDVSRLEDPPVARDVQPVGFPGGVVRPHRAAHRLRGADDRRQGQGRILRRDRAAVPPGRDRAKGLRFQVQVSSGRPGDRRIKNRLRES